MKFKFGIIAVAVLLASCTSDLPDTPKFVFCKLSDKCFSVEEISESDCAAFGGEIISQNNFEDANCSSPP